MGRAQELAQLHEAFKESRGHTKVVLVEGESGIGKSALTQRFTHELVTRSDALVFKGRCYSRESVPFKAVDNLIDALSRWLRSLPRDAVAAYLPVNITELARLFPVFNQVKAIADIRQRGRKADGETQHKAFVALREMLSRLAMHHPVVLVIDDLQWGDVDSSRLLLEILGHPDAPPLLFLGVCRPVDQSPVLDRLRRNQGDRRPIEIALERLSVEDASALLHKLAPDVPPSRRDAWLKDADGHPFFLEQFAQTSSDALSLEEMLATRFEQLSRAALDILESISIAAYPLEVALAIEVSGGHLEAIHQMTTSRLLLRQNTDGVELLLPYHARIREFCVERLAAEEIRARHLRLAQVIEGRPESSPDRLLYHYFEAGHHTQAAHFARLAARQSCKATAFVRASELFQMALDHGDFSGDDTQGLRLELAEALGAAGRAEDAAAVYREASTHAEGLESSRLKVRELEQQYAAGHFESFAVFRDELRRSVGLDARPSVSLTRLVASRLLTEWRGFEFQAREQVDERTALMLEVSWVSTFGTMGSAPLLGYHYHNQHLRLALSRGTRMHIARALLLELLFNALLTPSLDKIRARSQAIWGHLDPLLEHLEHDAEIQFLTTLMRAAETNGMGHFRESLDLLKSLDGNAKGESCWSGVERMYLLGNLVMLGDLRESTPYLSLLREQTRESKNEYFNIQLAAFELQVFALSQDDQDASTKALSHLIEQTNGENFIQAWWRINWIVQASLFAGAFADAYANLEEVWSETWRGCKRTYFYRIDVWYLRGRCASGVAHQDREALKLLRKCAQQLKKMGDDPWPVAYALQLDAMWHHANGETAQAARLFDRAAQAFLEVEMKGHSAACRLRHAQLLEDPAQIKTAQQGIHALGYNNPERLANVWVPLDL